MIYAILDGIDSGMKVDVVIVLIDRSLLAFAKLLARMATSVPVSPSWKYISNMNRPLHIHCHHSILSQQTA